MVRGFLMMKKIFKRISGILGINSLLTLGFAQYVILLISFLSVLPKMVIVKSLWPLHKKMSKKTRIKFKNYNFIIDCRYADEIIQENSFTFGLIAEICIENCYLKHHNIDFTEMRNVIDLGANRGVFACLAANFCEKVVAVEPQEIFHKSLAHNMAINNRTNYCIESSFVGGKGKLYGYENNTVTIEKIMQKNNFATVDFLKMDIEGSEFGLFQEISCLDKVKYLSMEVHPEYGDAMSIVNKLKEHGFSVVLSDRYCDITSDTDAITYIYAFRAK